MTARSMRTFMWRDKYGTMVLPFWVMGRLVHNLLHFGVDDPLWQIHTVVHIVASHGLMGDLLVGLDGLDKCWVEMDQLMHVVCGSLRNFRVFLLFPILIK